ncbi:hypothetical protein [Flammeovirga pacifica]|uniref:Lysozyme inhibitor LprI N-terminal domain-containing protein n=1 Tax=Flammeovirga pacifica TaxID=915059 RepID=A0A1S1YSQ4_FLAPC|nr:hypothetical protein [Flammeovirga pacifica]OHX64062.1 hypothetical protein NH26_20865 [Flammeovirga pacifica]
MKTLLTTLFFVFLVQLSNAENVNKVAVDDYINWLQGIVSLNDTQIEVIRELRKEYETAISTIPKNDFERRTEVQINFWKNRNKQLDRESLVKLGTYQITDFEIKKVKEMLGFSDEQVAALSDKLSSYNKVLMGAKHIYDTNSQEFKEVEEMVYTRTYEAIEEICSESQKQRCGDMKNAILTKINKYINRYIHYSTTTTIN